MTLYIPPGQTFHAILNNAPTGLVGTLAARIRNLGTSSG